jgi:uncharacterized membrane protein YgcG
MNGTGTALLTTRDVYDVAQLAGGLPRVVDTAVVTLLERGRLKVDGFGRLQAVGTAVHPVEAAVLDLAGPRFRRTVAGLRVRAQEEPRLTGVAERLVAQGLLRRNPFAGLCGSWPAQLRTAAGRRVLAEWRDAPVGGSSTGVALDGSARMVDRVLAETVFGAVLPAPARRPGRRTDSGTPVWAFGGWGGDGGGGGWGGDGGGGGGGCGDGGGGGC